MTTYLWIQLAFCVLTVFVRAVYLSLSTYPRRIEVVAVTDVISLVVNIGMAAWTAVLLWGGP